MIFVDTGAWFAVAVQNDPDHAAAMRWLGQNREPLITTDHVLAETATLILQKALQVFRDYSDHLFSFVDCTSFAVMERLGINHAFAFDSHFDEYSGIIRVPR